MAVQLQQKKTLNLHPVPDAGPDLSVNCYISDTVILNGDGSGTWAFGVRPGDPVISDINNPNAVISGFPAPGSYQLYYSGAYCEDVVMITVGDNCDCPAGDNQIFAPALAEICNEYPSTLIGGNEATPAGGMYIWQMNTNSAGFVTATGINNTKDYTTATLAVGDYLIRRVYTVQVNGQDCVYESNPVSITVHANPTAQIIGDDEICEGESTTFTASGGVSYDWGGSIVTDVITVSDNTERTVMVTDANGCTDSASKTLVVNANPTAAINGDNEVCEGESATFTANGGTTYLWSNGATTQSITVSNNTPVDVTVRDANGCTDSASKTLVVNSNPTAIINGDDEVCEGESAAFTASGGTTYLWSNGATNQSITVSTITPAIVTVTDANGCTDTETKTLTVNAVPDAGPDMSANCYVNDVVTMSATGTGTWTLITTGVSVTIANTNNPNTTLSGFSGAGTYELVWSNGNCEDVVMITVGDNCDCPAGDNQIFAPALSEICNEYPSTLIGGNDATPGGGMYIWQMNTNGAGFVTATGINNTKDYTTATLAVGDYLIRRVYTVQVNGQDCVYESNPVSITVHANPTAQIIGDDEICEGESTTFTASGGVSYDWGGSIVTDVITVSDNTERTVMVTDANGCTDSASKTLVVNANPTAVINGDNEVCEGESATFMANGGTTYLWSNGATTQSITVSNNTPVDVTVRDANGCTDSASKTLVVNSNPTAIINGDDEVCEGESAAFTASGGTTYLWSNGATNQSITVSTITPAIVTVTDANGCTDTETKTLTVNAVPDAGPDMSANCYVNDVVTMSATGTGTWTLITTGVSVTIANTNNPNTTLSGFSGAGTYELVWSNGNCEDVVMITVGDNCDCPAGDNQIFAPALSEICNEYPSTLIGGNDATPGGGMYIWQMNTNSAGFVTATGINNTKDYTTATLAVGDYLIRRVYTVQVNGQDCVYESNPVSITVHANPTAQIIGDDEICEGESTTFTASGGVSYDWGGSIVTDVITVSDNTERTVMVTDANGCTDSASKTLVVNANPTAVINGDNEVCEGESATFMANGGTTYLWSNGATTQSITVSNNTPVDVTVRDANGCTDSASKTLVVNSNPTAIINGDDEVCEGESAAFTASGGTTYLWSNGATNQSITVSTITPAIVTVTDANGCTDTETKTLTVNAVPDAGPDMSANCYVNDVVTMSATGTGTWTLITTGVSVTIANTNNPNTTLSGFSGAGTYELVWSNGNCEDVVMITVGDNCDCPAGDNQIFAPALSEICNEYPSTLIGGNDATPGGGMYIWQMNTNGAGFVTATGINNTKDYTTATLAVGDYLIRRVYTVQVNGQDCVYESNPVSITVHANPTAQIIGDDEICEGESTTFTASGGVSYDWGGSIVTDVITVSDNTERTVMVTDANGCTDSASKTLIVYANPTAAINGDNEVCEGESATFTASGGTTYLWSNGATTQSITVSNNTPVDVTVRDANGCTDNASKTLVVNSNPTAIINGDDEVCEGESAAFTASGGTTYLWSNGATNQSITVSTITPAIVTVTDANGCTDTAEKILTIYPYPDAGENLVANCFSNDEVIMQAYGTGTWTLITPGLTVKISDVNDPNATMSDFSGPGMYEFIWTNGHCEDRVLVNVNDNCDCPDGDNSINGPVSTAVCVIFPDTKLSGVNTVVLGGSYTWFYERDNGTATIVANTEDHQTGDLPVGNHKYQRVYSLQVNNKNCIYNSNVIGIDVHPEPEAVIQGDNEICSGNQTTLTATGGVSYLWSTGEITESITVTNVNEVFVTVTNQFSCQDVANLTISNLDNPVVGINGLDEICEGQTATFTAFGGESYNWSNNETNASITIDVPGDYTVTVTDSNGCTATASKTLIVNPLPEAGNDKNINCYVSGSIAMNATGTGTWTFTGPGTASISNPSDPNTLVTGFSAPGVYELVWSDGKCEDKALIVVNDNCDCPVGDNSIIGTDISVCKLLPETLITGNDATPSGGTYRWEYSNNSGTYVLAPGINNNRDFTTEVLNTGTHSFVRIYTVIVDNKECIYYSNEVSFRVNPEPVANITGQIEICNGQETEFVANGGDNYIWSSGEVVSTIFVRDNTERVVTVTDANGCSATATKTLTILDNPVASVSGPDFVCVGEEVEFTATGGDRYEWNTGELISTITVKDDRERIVTVTDLNGCFATASKTLTVVNIPDAGPDLTVNCWIRDNVIMNGSGTGIWTYVSSAGTANIQDITNPNTIISDFSAPGLYEFTWSNGQCSDVVSVTVNDNCDCPDGDNTVGNSGNVEICGIYPSTELTGNDGSPAGGQYIWEYAFNNGGFGPATGVNDAKDYTTLDLTTGQHDFRRIYTVLYNGNVCVYTSQLISVLVHPEPVAAIIGDDKICEGKSTAFTASGGISYEWNIGGNSQSIDVNDDRLRTVTVTDNNGCTATASKILDVLDNPVAVINNINAICEGSTTSFTAGGGVNYIWNTGETGPVITVGNDLDRIVTVTDVNGCTATASSSVTINPLPVAVITGGGEICAGETSVFTATGGVSYIWSSGETTTSVSVSDDIERIVTVTDVNSCSNTASKTLIVNNVNNAGDDINVDCYKDAEVIMKAEGSGVWTAGSNNPSMVIIENNTDAATRISGFSAPGTYTFIWSDVKCSDVITVIVGDDCPCEDVMTEIYPPQNPVFCEFVKELVITGNRPSADGSFEWEYSYNAGSFAKATGISNEADYKAENLNVGTHSFRRIFIFSGNDNKICTDTSNIVLIEVINALENDFDLTLYPDPVCVGDTVFVSANSLSPSTYKWTLVKNNGVITGNGDNAVIIPLNEGEFTLAVTQISEFCEQVSEPKYFDFTVNPLPRVVLGRDTIICDQDEGFEIKIDNYEDITWNDGSKGNSIYVEESGIYEVMVKDENGCIGHDEIVIKDFCCKVYYPNIIKLTSANYVNRQFQIKESGCVVSSELWIYDRWGNLVYKSDDGLLPWDGTFSGDFVEQGVYTFIFKYKALDENDKEFSEKVAGDITILR
jgi:uncharacterized protein YodC (DUF2158 family)